MDDYAWLEELRRRSLFDPWVKECLARVERMTPQYEAILECLTYQQQEDLSDYIAACEEYKHSLTLLAYELGTEAKGDAPQ